jgi:hypothetical protein
MLALEFAAETVSLATRGLQIEHQVFHIQPQLPKGILDQIQDSAATLGELDDSVGTGFHGRTVLLRQ